jgi:hypothetical protein
MIKSLLKKLMVCRDNSSFLFSVPWVEKVENSLYKETFLPTPEEILVYSLEVFCTNIVTAKKQELKKEILPSQIFTMLKNFQLN